MVRPCFLVVDIEHVGSISTRKLVIETAKLNVVTAYSGAEAIETLKKYPNLDGVVVDAGVKDIACDEILRQLKDLRADIPVIVIGGPRASHCSSADYYLDSFEPRKLLDLIQSLNPRKTELLIKRDKELAEKELK